MLYELFLCRTGRQECLLNINICYKCWACTPEDKKCKSVKSRDKTDSFSKELGNLRCNECKAAFQEPVIATISSSDSAQTYYACPRCLTEVDNYEDQKNRETRKEEPIVNDIKKGITESEEDVECKHYFGYLKKRPTNISVPEECLTCSKMIECLLG